MLDLGYRIKHLAFNIELSTTIFILKIENVDAPKKFEMIYYGFFDKMLFIQLQSIILYLLQGLFRHFLNCQFLPDLLNLVLTLLRINLNLN